MLKPGDRFTCRAFRRLVYGVRSDGRDGHIDFGRLEFGSESVDMRQSGKDPWAECFLHAEDRDVLHRAPFRVIHVRPNAIGRHGVVFAVEEGPRGRVVQFDTARLSDSSIEVIP